MGRNSAIVRATRRFQRVRRTIKYDTQRLRLRAVNGLEELFNIARAFATGKVQHQRVNKKIHVLSMRERQMWARIAAYTAQIMNALAKGIDERQLDKDMDKLEILVNEAEAEAQGSVGPAQPKQGETVERRHSAGPSPLRRNPSQVQTKCLSGSAAAGLERTRRCPLESPNIDRSGARLKYLERENDQYIQHSFFLSWALNT